MKKFNEDFNNYIDNRVINNISKITKDNSYYKTYNNYHNDLKFLKEKLGKKENEILENIISLNNFMQATELNLAYKIGFADVIKFQNEIEIDKID